MKKPAVQKKWDRIASFYKWSNGAAERRWEPAKKALFSEMGAGNILFLAIGIGEEIRIFPEKRKITAIDISPRMLARAEGKAAAYNGSIRLMRMDAQKLTFAPETFDQVFTACTFCSVPDPVQGLKELNRVLKPGGELCMFEHTRSHHFRTFADAGYGIQRAVSRFHPQQRIQRLSGHRQNYKGSQTG